MNAPNIRDKKHFTAGLLYAVVGAAFAIASTSYSMGSAARMGPAYFPFWLGLLLAFVGLVMIVSSTTRKAAQVGWPKFNWKIAAWILGSILMFGFLLPRLGLIVSLVLLVLISSRASHEFRWAGAILNATILLVISLMAFVFGLGLRIPLWPALVESFLK